MQLREFQTKVLQRLSDYLLALDKQREKYKEILYAQPELATDIHIPKKAWEQMGLHNYQEATNGLGEAVPNLYLKVPTGGGKTLLACHSIDLINKLYLNKQNGLVLWIVPTKQIYSQTLKNLRDRNHPYRQFLDISSAGKTLILEKLDHFNIDDVNSNLCILLLMLPSASRQSNETLKVFKDNSGYTSFFPAEDAYKHQEELLKQFPNLDTFGDKGYLYGNLALTSLGNVLRLLRPITIIDEGHKAYSETARKTILGFNPSFVLELSATPPNNANKLISITGMELNDEQMIKLDLHLINKNGSGWKETVSEAVAKRSKLEKVADKYNQNTNVYIRPIMLIQVERTGKDQRDSRYIHAEDVKEYLLTQHSIPDGQVAIKSSEKDDIEGLDLLSQDCQIRFIITKQALQEGWDCPFAYVLCVLTKSQSETAMTQLIGRILRQPYAKKTKVLELDECYVFSFQQDTGHLVRGIKSNLESEGLGDLTGHIAVDLNSDDNPDHLPEREVHYRRKFKKFAGKIYLPVFAIKKNNEWREVSYQSDLLSCIDWSKIELSNLHEVALAAKPNVDDLRSIGFKGKLLGVTSELSRQYESEIDIEYVARQLLDIIPNPWIAFDIGQKAIDELLSKYDKSLLTSNLVFVMEELRKLLYGERERLSEDMFRTFLNNGIIKFYLLKGNSNSEIPSSVIIRSKERLNHEDGGQLQMSLFDYVPNENINDLEKEVALYLDKQHKLLWWYRNISRAGYRIQGWRPHGVFPDFVAANKVEGGTYDKVYVFETKGDQLAGNLDTEYKRALLNLCNDLAVEKNWNDLDLGNGETEFEFQMVDESSWESKLNELIGA